MYQTFYNLGSNEMGMSMEWKKTHKFNPLTLHIKGSFPIRISSVNATQFPEWPNFVRFTEEILNKKLHFLSVVVHRFSAFIGIQVKFTLFFLIHFEKLLKMSWSLSKTFSKAWKCDIILGIILVIVFITLFSNSYQQIYGTNKCTKKCLVLLF